MTPPADPDRAGSREDPHGGADPLRRRGPTGAPRPAGLPLGCLRGAAWGFLLVAGYLLLRSFTGGGEGTAVPYSRFRSQVDSDNVAAVTLQGRRVSGSFRRPWTEVRGNDTVKVTDFATEVPSFGNDDLLSTLEKHDVTVTVRPASGSSFLEIILWSVLPIVLLGGFLFYMMRGMGRQGRSLLSLGRSGARKYDPERSVATFADVAGAAGAKRELAEVVEFLREPERFRRLGAEIPKGILLIGPPGTGKTLLARAVAGEAGVSFFIITGSDFMEMFVGVGARRVRDLFGRAKEEAPSIIFIDELDSVGRRRGTGLGGGNDEREQTLNQLLSELDGFEPAVDVIVMAATNRPDVLDPALLRPGRFDRRIVVDLPTASERLEILRLHARELPLDPSVDLTPVANGTPGFSGADLKNLLNEAALSAARADRDRLVPEDLNGARDRVLLGLRREGLALSDEEMRLLAYHEGGHAVVAQVLPTTDPVEKVTIIPRGRTMGSTHQLPARDRYLWRVEELMDRLAVSLAGRAAEELVLGTVSTGAEDDLDRATQLARHMVLRWGMSEALGPFASGQGTEQVFLGGQIMQPRDHSEETAGAVDDEVRRILRNAAARARGTLEENREALDRVAERLLEKEEITGREVAELVGGG